MLISKTISGGWIVILDGDIKKEFETMDEMIAWLKENEDAADKPLQ